MTKLTHNDLERLSSWLRCYPVVGRESERKSLTAIVEQAMYSQREVECIHGLVRSMCEQCEQDAQ